MQDDHTTNDAGLPPSAVQSQIETPEPAPNGSLRHGLHHQGEAKSQAGHHRVRFLSLAFLLIVSMATGFLGGWFGARNRSDTTIQKQEVVLKSQAQLISSIAKNVGQSVVSIDAKGSTTTSNVFGFAQSGQQEDQGTGIILSSSGLIITNRHVVPAGTSSVSVTLSDGTTYNNVQIVGRTSNSDSLDIAFLQIQDTKGKQLAAAQLGDSSKVQVGDSVVAIGNALGQFQNTVTSGIISGYGRSVQASSSGDNSSSENLEDLFQTDAAINEGNSGGPLVNLDGQVIGINTAVAGNAQNIGFAIPINDVTGLIKSVEQSGKLSRPYLGVVYLPVTADLASQYNLSVSSGAWIPPSNLAGTASIVAGGPADKAGLKEGDVITAINGQTINQNTSLTSVLDKQAVGDKVTLTIVRAGKQLTVTATLAAAPSQ